MNDLTSSKFSKKKNYEGAKTINLLPLLSFETISNPYPEKTLKLERD